MVFTDILLAVVNYCKFTYAKSYGIVPDLSLSLFINVRLIFQSITVYLMFVYSFVDYFVFNMYLPK